MENQEQNQRPKEQQQNKYGQYSSKREQEPGKESEADTNRNDSADHSGEAKQNPLDRDSSVDGLNPDREDPQWPNESLPSGGLVDREIGEGSEDLNDADSDDDDF